MQEISIFWLSFVYHTISSTLALSLIFSTGGVTGFSSRYFGRWEKLQPSFWTSVLPRRSRNLWRHRIKSLTRPSVCRLQSPLCQHTAFVLFIDFTCLKQFLPSVSSVQFSRKTTGSVSQLKVFHKANGSAASLRWGLLNEEVYLCCLITKYHEVSQRLPSCEFSCKTARGHQSCWSPGLLYQCCFNFIFYKATYSSCPKVCGHLNLNITTILTNIGSDQRMSTYFWPYTTWPKYIYTHNI